MTLRRLLVVIVTAFSVPMFHGCAMAERPDAHAAPWTLPDSPDMIRVRIIKSKKPLLLSASGRFRYQSRRGGPTYDCATSVKIRASHGRLVIGQKSLKGDVAVFPQSSSDTLRLNGRRYRGVLVFHPLGGSSFDGVEYLELQEYLYGVLPREVGADWPLEALKAQAVVSRTYVLANRSTVSDQRFDVFNDVTHQVYGGLSDEAPATNEAVDRTRGLILTDSQGKTVQTFFHSSCGGATELPENVWFRQEATDVFGCIQDDYCKGDPFFHWQADFGKSAIKERLRRAGYRLGDIKKIEIGKTSVSGRAVTFWVYTSHGKTEIQGNRFRIALGPERLRSTLITNLTVGKKSIHVEGRGWGHGVGLCQWGAKGRAAAGQSFRDILSAYYPRAVLKQLDPPAP